MKPRVLHVIPTLEQGGAERVLVNLVANSGDRVEHHVAQILDRRPFFSLDGAEVTDLGASTPASLGLASQRLRQLIRQTRPQIVQGWLYHGNLLTSAAAGLGVPIVWSVHNTTLSWQQSSTLVTFSAWVAAPLSRFVPRRIVYCAESARILHERMGYARSKSVVIENGTALDHYSFSKAMRAEVRAKAGIQEDDIIFGMLARFAPQKNHALVLRSFAQMAGGRKARLLLAGKGCGPDNPALVDLVRSSGLEGRTLLLGARQDIRALLSAMDVLVIGSSFGEALPMVAIEAAAAGLPIVATRVGDVAPFVLDPAHLVPPNDANAMALALAHAAGFADAAAREPPELDPRRSRLQSYSIERMAERYVELYASLAKGAGRPPTARALP